MNNRLINTKVAGGGGGCTDIVDNYDPFGGGGLALYQLNGDATDVSTNYDGAATNVTWGGAGQFGTSAAFNGSSSKIQISGLSTFLGSSSSKSWSCWVKTTSTSGGNRAIISDYNTGTGNYNFDCFMTPGDGRVYLVSKAGGTGVNILSSATINNGVWHHICAVQNTTTNTLKLYIDSNLQGTISIGTGTRTSPLFIGTYGVGYYWDGSIDQVRIYNTGLDPLEVEALYTEELCICDGTVDTLQVLGDTSCIATYQLDGNANDLSGNYSGTPTDLSYGVGEFDLAGVFNGSSSYIDIPYSHGNTSFTWSIWVNSSSFSNQFPTVVGGMNGSTNTNNGNIWISGSQIVVHGTTLYGSVSYTFSTNTWYQVGMVYDSSANTIQAIINGTLYTPPSTTSVTFNSQNIMRLGRADNTATAWNGKIDQVRFFNKALNSTEVETLWLETACTKDACTGTTHTLNILGGGDTSCIAAYPLDGSPADLSGNYNGVQTDVTYPQGNFDLAGSFNGSSSRIDLPSLGGISPSSDFTISCWVNAGNQGGGDNTIVTIWDNTNIELRVDGSLSNTIRVVYNSGGFGAVNSNLTLTENEWTHLTVTYKFGIGFTFYKNSISSQLYSFTATASTLAGTNKIGAYGGAALSYFNGSIDQVRIFNKALNSTEVGILFNDENPCS